MRRALPLALSFLLSASPGLAQRSNQLTVEASVFRGALGYARQVAPALHAGVELGFGFPQIDRTLHPDSVGDLEPEFEEYLHVALLLRARPSSHFEVDLGVRGSVADVWPCRVSDCWPAGFLGGYVQPMVGWRRFKVGTRLLAGWIAEHPPERESGSTRVLALNPLIARLTLDW